MSIDHPFLYNESPNLLNQERSLNSRQSARTKDSETVVRSSKTCAYHKTSRLLCTAHNFLSESELSSLREPSSLSRGGMLLETFVNHK